MLRMFGRCFVAIARHGTTFELQVEVEYNRLFTWRIKSPVSDKPAPPHEVLRTITNTKTGGLGRCAGCLQEVRPGGSSKAEVQHCTKWGEEKPFRVFRLPGQPGRDSEPSDSGSGCEVRGGRGARAGKSPQVASPGYLARRGGL